VNNGQKASVPIFPAGITGLAYDDYQLPTSMQYNFGVQRELTRGTVLSVQYVGNSNYHQRIQRDVNAVPLSDPRRLDIKNGNLGANLARPYLGFSGITLGQNSTGSTYNSLQVNFRVQATEGLTLQAAYTWSHAIDYASGDFANLSNPFDAQFNRGPGDLDRRHILSLNYLYDIPIFRGRTDVVGSVLGGWEFSGITLIQTGVPLTPTLPYDNLGIGAGTARPDVVGNLDYPHTLGAWFDTGAFAAPPPLSFGSAGRGIIRGPGRTNFNLSLFKSFSMPFPGNPEGAKLQFRAESFNAFNHTQFHNVNTSFGNSNFGKVTSTYDPRVWQLGLKFLL
jgi:hypothetical protein